jgi:hypothetical protein
MITDAEEKGLITPGKVNCSIYYSCTSACWLLYHVTMLHFCVTIFSTSGFVGSVIAVLFFCMISLPH